MKLFMSLTSPYSRKVRILIREKGLMDRVEENETAVFEDPEDLQAANPLGRVPTLIREDGVAIYDSPIICEYLDNLSDPWLPKQGEGAWRARVQHALGDGLTDSVLSYRYETFRPHDLWWDMIRERAERAILRTAEYLEEHEFQHMHDGLDFGTLSIAVGLGYADFRAPDVNWRKKAPRLADWFANMAMRPSFKATKPPQP